MTIRVRHLAWALVAWMCLGAMSSVHAQSAPSDPQPDASTPSPQAVQLDVQTAPAVADAESLYDEAFAALAEGDRALAARRLQELQLGSPDHPLAAKARTLLAQLARSEPPPAAPTASPNELDSEDVRAPAAHAGPDPSRDARRGTSAARAELIFAQTVHGAALGLELCLIVECRESEPWVAMTMLGGGAGFAASLLLSSDGITPGLSRALTDGMLWGAAHGLETYFGAELDRGFDEEVRMGAALALGQLGGMGIAGLLYHSLRPTTGQVSIASSGGIWATVLTAQLLAAIQPDDLESDAAWLFMVVGDLGLIGGGVLGAYQPISASRALVIDAGGLLGTLIGLGLGVLVAPDSNNDSELTTTFAMGAIGTVAGLGTSYALSHDWDNGDDEASAHTPHFALSPTRDGATASLLGYW